MSASILLAIGVVPVAACHTSVVINCTGAKTEPGGLLLCKNGAVSRGVSAPCPTQSTPSPPYFNKPCTQDTDCGTAGVCYCGTNGGECIGTACKTNADCTPRHSCVLYGEGWCHGAAEPSFVCTTDSDECVSDAECGAGEACTIDLDRLACVKIVTGPCVGG